MHVTWLAGASTLFFAQHRDSWRGTLIPLFQPAEETWEGPRAMIDDGLFNRVSKPDVALGKHVMVRSSGVISYRSGVVTSAGDSLQIRIFGRGAHGSMPQASVDPVVMAASTVLRLQTTVSRGVAPTDSVVLTVVIVIQRLLMVSFLELLGLSPYNSKCRATALNGSHEIFVSIRFR